MLVNNKTTSVNYVQAVEPSDPVLGNTWFNNVTKEHKIFNSRSWENLFLEYENRLGPHTYNIVLYGTKLKVLTKISPLTKLYGTKLKVLTKISPLTKLYGTKLKVLTKISPLTKLYGTKLKVLTKREN